MKRVSKLPWRMAAWPMGDACAAALDSGAAT